MSLERETKQVSTRRNAFGQRAVLFCAISACLLALGKLAFSRTQTQEQVRRTLTFAERAAYQYAIEEVYWRHRIWPKETTGLKPPLDAIVSQRRIEDKVEDYLRKSQPVADGRGPAITGFELQREMDRMANQSRNAGVLGELFEALGNDPFLIAECLVRPILAERFVRECEGESSPKAISGRDNNPNQTAIPDPWPSAPKPIAPGTPKAFASSQADPSDVAYKLPTISSSLQCADSWFPTNLVNAPEARSGHTAVWTGSEMIVWGGFNGVSADLNTGARYDPATDSWTATSIVNVPDVRWLHTGVWTGSEMIVWGGGNFTGTLSTGGRYNPITDAWTATSMVTMPSARDYHTAVWTGSEMIVWGGRGCGGNCVLNTGGRYNPTNDSWTPTAIVNAPVARDSQSALWTGSEMIVWGGTDRTNYLHTGSKYNPDTDSWTPTGLTNVPQGRIGHSTAWTGDEMIVWGGVDETFKVTNTGGRYNPLTDSWVATSLAPWRRSGSTCVWTGNEMIVWGGGDTSGVFNTGGRYDRNMDSWASTTTVNAPSPRGGHTVVWTGSEMIVWGGGDSAGVLGTGGIYCAQSGPTSTPTPSSTPAPTPTATATAAATPTPTAIPTGTSTPTPTAAPSPTTTPAFTPGKAVNISTRLRVELSDNVMIGGFIVQGSEPKNVTLRGIGPSLASSGVSDEMADPTLELRDATGHLLFHNDNWQDDPAQAAQLIALNLAPKDPNESAIVAVLQVGAYTAILAGKDNNTGVGLLEVYDTNQPTTSQLANISTRGFIQTGDNVMIGGFILGEGNGGTSVALRGIGPSLSQSGLNNVLADPTLELRDSNGALLVSNDNWQDNATSAAQLTAHGLAPQNPLESGIFESLTPGAFTAILAGKNGGVGIGLVEIYCVQ